MPAHRVGRPRSSACSAWRAARGRGCSVHDDDDRLGGGHARPPRHRSAHRRRAPHPPPRAGRDQAAGVGLRGVPDRPPPGRGRPPSSTAATVPGHEVIGTVDAVGDGCRRFVVGQRAGIAWLRHTCGSCLVPAGRENLCLEPASPGGTRMAATPSTRSSTSAYAYRLPDGFDDEHRPAAVRRHHRLPGAAPGRGATGRPAGHLRLRGVGPPGRPGGAGRRGDRPRADPVGRGAAAGARAGCALRRWRRRRTARAARRRHPVRPRRRPGPVALAALDRGGTLAVAGIHLTDVPRSTTSAAPLPGAPGPQRHRQHPGRRRGVPHPGRPAGICTWRPRPTPSTPPTGRWPTWPPTG